jgi:tetratricopeptide (TPR) repeat protein
MTMFTLIEHGNYLYSAVSRIAKEFRMEGDWQRAAQLYEAALLVRADAIQLVRVQIGLSELLIKWAHYDRANSLLSLAYRTATEEDELSLRGEALYYLGDVHYYRQTLRGDSSHSLALDFHQQAHDLFQAIDEKERVADAMWRIGTVKEAQKERDAAAEWYQKAIDYAQSINYEAGIGAPKMFLAALKRRDDMDNARKEFEEALLFSQKSNDLEEVAIAALYLGRHLVLMEQDLDAALDYMHKARVLAEQLGHVWIMWASYTRIGDYHVQQKNVNEARTHYHQALSIARRHDLYAMEKESAGALQTL